MAICGISKRVLLSYLVPIISQVVPSSAVCCRSLNSKCDLLMPFKSWWFQRSRYVHISRMLFCVASQPIATVRPVVNKISRAAMAEARAVLFDYLQHTRSFQFSDADHISRNSDRFLLDLLSKVDIKENVTKSLSRYLRFNPINEFEPFFESLGMTPDEYSAHLPRDLMFLSDNQVLLDNFHDLCNYGIPRGKMGKIYAEVESIFRYDYGVLASKFRAYEEFGLSKSSLIKFFTCDPSLLVGDANTNFIDFVQILNKIGLDDRLARYVSAEHSYNWARISQTVELLDRLAYGGDTVAKLFRNEPGLLLENSGMVIQILIRQLTKLGFKKDDVVTLFLQDPTLMSKKRLKNLSHSMTFLFEIGIKLEDIAYVVQTHKHILSSNTPKRPGTVLRYLKVGESALRKMIKKDPTILFVSSSTSCPEDYKEFSYSLQTPARDLEKVTFLKSLGYNENSEEFVEAAKRFGGRGDQLQERFNCLIQAGLDSYTVADIIKRVPRILRLRKEVLEQKIHLLTNVMGYPLESLVSSPIYLCYDVKRISLRFSMYLWLRDRGVGKPAMSLNSILWCSEEQFVKQFVDIHDDGQAAWENLKKSLQPRTALRTLKVGKSALHEMIKKDPTKLFVSSSTSCSKDHKALSYYLQTPARYLEKATFLKWLGYIENTKEFVKAGKRFQGRGDQLQERFNCLVQAGLDSCTVADIIKRAPPILNQSKEVLEQKIHLLTNVMGYPLKSLVSSPTYLCYNVKRIGQRFSMYLWLRDRGVAKPAMPLSTFLYSEERFVKYFVDIHDDGQAAWEKLKKS